MYENDITGVIDFWINYQQSMETAMNFSRDYHYKPWDGAVAVTRAFEKNFGTRGRQLSSFFQKPQMISINVGPHEKLQVPWGKIAIPIFKGVLNLGAWTDENGNTLFRISVSAPKKFEGPVNGLFEMVEAELRENSIYRGKAFDGADMPNFLDLEFYDDDKVIFNDVTLHQLEANLWAPIRYPQVMRDMGVDAKRTILMQGTYGTGKTLAAIKTAVICQGQERTFIMCNPKDNNVFEVLDTASIYQPSCVFVEDIDVLTSQGEDQNVQMYLDKFDGLTAKGKDIIVVMTTNNVERIHKGMLRPGRLDAIISIPPHDRKATEKMIRSLFKADQLADDVDFDQVYDALEGFTPAFVKETCEKVKLYSVARGHGTLNGDKYETLDFLAAAQEMRDHYNLHKDAGEGEKTPTLDRAMREAVTDAVQQLVVHDAIEEVDHQIVEQEA